MTKLEHIQKIISYPNIKCLVIIGNNEYLKQLSAELDDSLPIELSSYVKSERDSHIRFGTPWVQFKAFNGVDIFVLHSDSENTPLFKTY